MRRPEFTSLRPLLLRLVRSAVAGRLLSIIFARAPFLLPMTPLYKTSSLLAFHHPHPSYQVHIVLVPRRSLPDLSALSAADTDFMHDLFAAVQALVRQFGLEAGGYRLIVNGGAYQEVPHLHFHLIGERGK